MLPSPSWGENAYKYKVVEPITPSGEVDELDEYIFVCELVSMSTFAQRLSDQGVGLRGCNSDDDTGCHSSSTFALVPTLGRRNTAVGAAHRSSAEPMICQSIRGDFASSPSSAEERKKES
jgi:hypothetical protein